MSVLVRREGPVVVCILDGYGLGKEKPESNPIVVANPTHINQIIADAKAQHLYVPLRAHGPAVGLPAENDMGNSEVGHNAMGCGQIYSQGTKLVDESFASGRLTHTPNWEEVVVGTARKGGALHMFGLLSDGNIHSHMSQVVKLLDGAQASGIRTIRVHILLDGRDVPPESGLTYVDQLEAKLADLRAHGVDALIASGGGRMYVTMDRYESDWVMVRRGWHAMVRGVVEPTDISANYPGYFHSAREAIECCRQNFPDKKDQYALPFVIVDAQGTPVGRMKDGDACLNWNFRGDRAIEISKAFEQDDFNKFDRVARPNVLYAGLLEYDTEVHIPRKFLVPPPEIQNILGTHLCQHRVHCYAVAETHKYGHVTFFWNGNRSGYCDAALEKYEQVESLPNALTESRPEMKAREVTDKLIAALRSHEFKFLRVNYANGDMVGHTGNFQSCVRTIQVLDEEIGRLDAEVRAQHGVLLLLADHGNVEDKDAKGSKTSHTCALVPFAVRDYAYQGEYVVVSAEERPDGPAPIEGPGLSNLAATVCNLLGLEAPHGYRHSLIRHA